MWARKFSYSLHVGFGLGNSLSGRVRVVRFSPFGYRVMFRFVGYFVWSGWPFISDPMYTSNVKRSHSLIIQTLHIVPWENEHERRIWYLTSLIASQNQMILNGFKTLSRLSRSNSLVIEALWDAMIFPNVLEDKFAYVIYLF